MISDKELEDFDRLDRLVTSFALQREEKLLRKLNVAELRVLLVHYKIARDAAEAKEWPKPDMVAAIADKRVEDEL